MLSLLVVSSCNTDYYGKMSLQPYSLNLTPPKGPENYRKGWADGCESGANAYSNPFYKQIKAFDYRYDPTLRNDKVYTQIWKDAFIYCSIYWERLNSLGGNI
ncbi:MAG: hypothetical protein SFT90_05480 [Rickettsiales bacterium]|nr:hypothetical protein [Rickettsiales bacterium]